MSTVQICDRWELPLLDGSGGHYQYLDSISKRNAACFLELVDGLHIESAVEYFGGVGIFSTIIQQVLHPYRHSVFDLDADCVAQLRTIQGLQVAQGDAHETMGTATGDLVVCDFPVCTLRTLPEWPLERIVALHPRYIVVSDTALRRLGLHRELYSKLSGEPVFDLDDYVKVYSESIWKRCGYSVTRVAHHLYSYFLLEPLQPGTPTITKVSR